MYILVHIFPDEILLSRHDKNEYKLELHNYAIYLYLVINYQMQCIA